MRGRRYLIRNGRLGGLPLRLGSHGSVDWRECLAPRGSLDNEDTRSALLGLEAGRKAENQTENIIKKILEKYVRSISGIVLTKLEL